MIIGRLRTSLLLTSAAFVIGAAGVFVWADRAEAQARDSSSAAATEIRFQQLEKEIRRLTAQIEEQNYEIRRLRGELSSAVGDFDVRMKDIEGGSAAPASSSSSYTARPVGQAPQIITEDPPEIGGASPAQQDPASSFQYNPPGGQTLGTLNQPQGENASVSSSDTASRSYDYAYSFVKTRDFDRAEKEFAKFIQAYPDHSLVSNAKYWYGETFYVRGSYDKAARVFAEGYQQYPEGPKAASNLLKLGMSLTGMGKTDDACIAFKQLKKDYANSSVPVLKRASTEMKRINCK